MLVPYMYMRHTCAILVQVMQKAGLTVNDLDVIEFHEVTLTSMTCDKYDTRQGWLTSTT